MTPFLAAHSCCAPPTPPCCSLGSMLVGGGGEVGGQVVLRCWIDFLKYLDLKMSNLALELQAGRQGGASASLQWAAPPPPPSGLGVPMSPTHRSPPWV